ncbi:MAG: DUF998 domain-containing protein [Alphaproteobacteria bacterium]|nr:DUF998 domain-containing protein [Alphaproteobacteria bacterium]
MTKKMTIAESARRWLALNPRLSATHVGVAVAATAIVIGPFFNVADYSSLRHSTSELGAQGAPGAWIMNAGFTAFGLGVLIDAVRAFRISPVPAGAFIVFGLAMIMNAVFSHRPIDPVAPYVVFEDDMHSFFSSVVGASFAIGVLAFGFARRDLGPPAVHAVAVAAALILPLGMFLFAEIEGALQRAMFFVSFAWFAAYLPRLAMRRHLPG